MVFTIQNLLKGTELTNKGNQVVISVTIYTSLSSWGFDADKRLRERVPIMN